MRSKNSKLIFVWLLAAVVLLAGLFLARPAAAQECSPTRVVNQWGCESTTFNMCDKPFWNECPPDKGKCFDLNDGDCPITTNQFCKVLYNRYAPCTGAPSCQTVDPVSGCSDGIDWKSSCDVFDSQNLGCWIIPDATPAPTPAPTPPSGGGCGSLNCTFSCQANNPNKECIPNSTCTSTGWACRDSGCTACVGSGTGTGGGMVTLTNRNPLCSRSPQSITGTVNYDPSKACQVIIGVYLPGCVIDDQLNKTNCTLVREWGHGTPAGTGCYNWQIGPMDFVPTVPGNYVTLARLGSETSLYPLLFWKAGGGGYDFTVIQCAPSPTPCANSLPAGLALSSPANGSTVGSPVILSWSLTNWGNRCYTSPNRQFKVYLGSNPPPLWSTIINPDIRSTTYSTGTPGSTYYWKVAATNDAWGTSAETPVRSFTLTAPSSSWFQVVGGDVVAATGDISVSGPGVPVGQKFLASPDAAMIYAGNSSGITSAQVDGWQVNSALSPSVVQNNSYARFKIRVTNRIVPKDLNGLGDLSGSCTAPEADGACYFISSSPVDITLPAQTISKKIVLLIDGDSGNVKVGGNISLSGGGLLVVLAKNNITLAGTVSALQGIYLAQNIFNTGASNTALQVDGTVVGLGSVTLARTFASDTTPAEKFVFHPEYTSALPAGLYEKNLLWQEFAP